MTEMTEIERLRRERDMAYSERDNATAHRDGALKMMTYSRECARDEGYSAGRKRALIGVLRSVVGELLNTDEDDDTEHEANEGRLLIERHEAILTLRGICEKHGDNDWSDNLHLSDIIEKHLERHLEDKSEVYESAASTLDKTLDLLEEVDRIYPYRHAYATLAEQDENDQPDPNPRFACYVPSQHVKRFHYLTGILSHIIDTWRASEKASVGR